MDVKDWQSTLHHQEAQLGDPIGGQPLVVVGVAVAVAVAVTVQVVPITPVAVAIVAADVVEGAVLLLRMMHQDDQSKYHLESSFPSRLPRAQMQTVLILVTAQGSG